MLTRNLVIHKANARDVKLTVECQEYLLIYPKNEPHKQQGEHNE